MMKVWKLNKAACPHCGHVMNAATQSKGEEQAAPEPGALSICINCIALNQFADDGDGGLKIVEFDRDELDPEERNEIEELLAHMEKSRIGCN